MGNHTINQKGVLEANNAQKKKHYKIKEQDIVKKRKKEKENQTE